MRAPAVDFSHGARWTCRHRNRFETRRPVGLTVCPPIIGAPRDRRRNRRLADEITQESQRRCPLPSSGPPEQALQRRAGVPQRRRGRGATAVPAALVALGITTREADVLTLVAAGMTNPQIADRLYISPGTVKSHLESLLRKTGSTGRTQLATLAAAHGLAGTTGEPGR